MSKSLEMGQDEEFVYEVLLEKPNLSVAALSDTLGWPPERVSAAFNKLIHLASLGPGDETSKSRIARIRRSLISFLDRQEEELMRRQKEIATSRQVIFQLLAEYAETDAADHHGQTRRLEGMEAIQSLIRTMAGTCTSEVAVFAPGGGQPTESLDAAKPLDSAVLERGVRVRYVYLDSVRNDGATTEYAQWLTQEGGQVRTVPHLPTRLLIYDRALAIVPVNPQVADAAVIALEDLGVVSALQALFERTWEQASPLGEDRARDAHGLTAQERAVLELLARGFTDEMIARKLAVSVRTVRRMTASLMTRLNAGSRFQAGVLAVARNWLRS
ncbi:helix-turn-helix transcriptional regulator [Streptomyces sp. HC44]|uniref:Helix-turn-helix transcriptional regulator n=1 Tax=Streptomyces scabichelini TaxID=2711217 RepID=A0A6G4V0Z2_9ACTN|nr:LuxR C-terminal-related transcriptional regulator [Streptomyces scabichelini]NGO07570.1 helix-turn-helix transcriptional regulator [Streptomyces scabichelini]